MEEGQTIKKSEPLVISNRDDAIILSITKFKGKEYLDIRKYFMDDAGVYKPTKKGISLPIDDVDNPALGILNDSSDFLKLYIKERK